MIALITGLILSSTIILAFFGINNWHFPAVVGIWMLFGLHKDSSYRLLFRDLNGFLKIFAVMFLLGCGIELIGRFILHWWTYPYMHTEVHELLLLLFYPFILLSFRDMFTLFRKHTGYYFAFIASMSAGMIIWEVPNLWSNDWVYHWPLNIAWLGIPVVLFLGWVPLILLPTAMYETILMRNTKKAKQ